MTIGEGLRAYLLGDMDIESLVSARVYPLRLPQPKKDAPLVPAIVYQRVSEARDQHLRGAGTLTPARYQVDAYGLTHDSATALGLLVRARLDGFAGAFVTDGSPSERVNVQAVLFLDARDLFESDILGGLCRYSADYRVVYRSTQ